MAFTLDTSGAKPITAKQALAALDRYKHCQARHDKADHAGNCSGPGTFTAERYYTTAGNWLGKADAAMEIVRGFIMQEVSK